jgi:hypothetical protein
MASFAQITIIIIIIYCVQSDAFHSLQFSIYLYLLFLNLTSLNVAQVNSNFQSNQHRLNRIHIAN